MPIFRFTIEIDRELDCDLETLKKECNLCNRNKLPEDSKIPEDIVSLTFDGKYIGVVQLDGKNV